MYRTFLKWAKKIWEKTKDLEQFNMTTTQLKWHVLLPAYYEKFLSFVPIEQLNDELAPKSRVFAKAVNLTK